MDISFADEKDKFVVIYMDDITIYSRFVKDHIRHLERVFIKCRKYGISLNTRNSNFTLEEGKLLGHVKICICLAKTSVFHLIFHNKSI